MHVLQELDQIAKQLCSLLNIVRTFVANLLFVFLVKQQSNLWIDKNG